MELCDNITFYISSVARLLNVNFQSNESLKTCVQLNLPADYAKTQGLGDPLISFTDNLVEISLDG